MKYTLIILLSAMLTFSLAAQEQRSRVKRETGNEQPAEARERKIIVLELSQKRLDLFERGDKERLSVLRSASGEIPPAVRWISDDPAIARIDENGYVEPAGPGSTTVWAQTADGRRTGKCIVTVTKPLKWGCVSGQDRLVVQEPWVYFSNKADNDKLYKVLINGSSLTKLSDDVPANLNVTGQWMYYYNLNDDTQKGVYRMSVDGKMRTCLIDNDFVSYLRVNREGWMYYLNGDNEVYALRTHKPNEPRRKMFDEKPVYSMAVNDYYIVYNRHWEDIPQPQGGGGLFLYDIKENKKEEYVSVNRNTYGLVFGDDEETIFFGTTDHDVNLPFKFDLFSSSDKAPQGWFSFDLSVMSAQEKAAEMILMQNMSPQERTNRIILQKLSKTVKIPLLTKDDRIVMAVDEWIYYSRNGSIRRIRENGQQDQAVSGVITGSDSFPGLYAGSNYLFYWTKDNKLIRTLPDGRNSFEIKVMPQP